jgi:cell division protease FtsH
VENRKVLDNIAAMLMEKETVDAEELQQILMNNDVKMAAIA